MVLFVKGGQIERDEDEDPSLSSAVAIDPVPLRYLYSRIDPRPCTDNVFFFFVLFPNFLITFTYKYIYINIQD